MRVCVHACTFVCLSAKRAKTKIFAQEQAFKRTESFRNQRLQSYEVLHCDLYNDLYDGIIITNLVSYGHHKNAPGPVSVKAKVAHGRPATKQSFAKKFKKTGVA